jgi:hypothetical protein
MSVIAWFQQLISTVDWTERYVKVKVLVMSESYLRGISACI